MRLCALPNGCIHLTIGEEDDFWLIAVQPFNVWNTVNPNDYHSSNDGDDSDTSGIKSENSKVDSKQELNALILTILFPCSEDF